MWRSLVARLVRDEEVGGSNPLTPTTYKYYKFMSYILVYITCKDEIEASMIAEKLLEENIIACANVFPPHKAVYRWEDKVESEEETAMILKTRSEHFERIQDTVKALHSYDTPAMRGGPRNSDSMLSYFL